MDRHLSETAIEAFAHGRNDLVADEDRLHLADCAECQASIEETRGLSFDFGAQLREAAPVPDLDALVRHALEAAQAPAIPEVVRPSLRALLISAILGLLATLGFGIAALPTPTAALSFGRHVWAVMGAVDRVVTVALPGGWTLVGAAGFVVLVALVVPFRKLLGLPALRPPTEAVLGVLGVVGLVLAFGSSSAHALDFEGEWPEDERTVSVSVESQPASDVLRQAAESAGLGYVATYSSDDEVTLHVRDAGLRDVVEAVLADAPVVVRRTSSMLIVRPSEQATVSEEAVSAEPPQSPAAELSIPDAFPGTAPVADDPPSATVDTEIRVPEAFREPSAPIRDRVRFGQDIHIRLGERVKDATTMGGDVVVEGEVVGDLATMGGDATVKRGGVVQGDIVTMGGDLTVEAGGAVHGEMVTMGGDIDVQDGALADGRTVTMGGEHIEIPMASRRGNHRSGFARWLEEGVGSAATHGLLFLFGLLLLALTPERFAAVRRTIVRAPGRSVVSGGLGVVGAIVLVVVLAITIVGIPGAAIVFICAFLATYVGLVAAASVLGAALPITALRDRPILQLGVGLGVFFVASLIPVLGGLVALAAAVLGLGAVLLTRFGKRAPGEP